LKIHEKYYENTDKNDDIDTIIWLESIMS
jgi:hypothetical protein